MYLPHRPSGAILTGIFLGAWIRVRILQDLTQWVALKAGPNRTSSASRGPSGGAAMVIAHGAGTILLLLFLSWDERGVAYGAPKLRSPSGNARHAAPGWTRRWSVRRIRRCAQDVVPGSGSLTPLSRHWLSLRVRGWGDRTSLGQPWGNVWPYGRHRCSGVNDLNSRRHPVGSLSKDGGPPNTASIRVALQCSVGVPALTASTLAGGPAAAFASASLRTFVRASSSVGSLPICSVTNMVTSPRKTLFSRAQFGPWPPPWNFSFHFSY
jgi:hypothetical protein